MPRFYFDTQLSDAPWFEDREGDLLRDRDRARLEALDHLRDLAKEHLREHATIRVRVRDDRPPPLLILNLSLSESGPG